MYAIKEIYYTLQGEGFHTGQPAVFCRFSGCNLWNGLEKDRANAICKFCDTEFFGTDGVEGGKYEADALCEKIKALWPGDSEKVFAVFTGGEPGLQFDEELLNCLKQNGIYSAIETNGTIALPHGIDWICVSPKANTEILQRTGNEIKIVYPQPGINPHDFKDFDFDHYYLQPLYDASIDLHTIQCLNFCREYPQWKISMQTHKILGIP